MLEGQTSGVGDGRRVRGKREKSGRVGERRERREGHMERYEVAVARHTERQKK